MPAIKFTIITLFPEALQPYLDSSMLYKAQERGIIEVEYVNLRDFGLGPHKSVDDTPYGGGDGMLLRCEPVFAAIESIKSTSPEAKVFLPTPVGAVWNQALARRFAGITTQCTDMTEKSTHVNQAHTPKVTKSSQTRVEALEGTSSENLAPSALMPKTASEGDFGALESKTASSNHDISSSKGEIAPSGNTGTLSNAAESSISSSDVAKPRHYIILCPHYEGYDQRILSIVDYPISLGNYVLTGGELPALIIIDSITRLLPGVLGGATSAEIESFSDGDNLEYPQYTKPADFRGMKVPDVLLSGHHGKVAEWRRAHSSRVGENQE